MGAEIGRSDWIGSDRGALTESGSPRVEDWNWGYCIGGIANGPEDLAGLALIAPHFERQRQWARFLDREAFLLVFDL